MYGLDLGNRELMAARSWFWLRWHIEQLLNRPPTLVVAPSGALIFQPSTRLGLALKPLTIIEPAAPPSRED